MAAIMSQATYAHRFTGPQLVQKEPSIQNRFLSPCVHRSNLSVNRTLLFSSLSSKHSLESVLSGREAAVCRAGSKAGRKTALRAFANADSVSSPSNFHPRPRPPLNLRKSLERIPSKNLTRRQPQRGSVIVRVLGGGGSGDDSGKQLGKVLGAATWGLVIWSALTGQLNWFFEGLTVITLAIFAIPVLLLLVFLGFLTWANSRQIQGPCPTCGASLSFVQMSDSMMIVDSANPIPVQIPINDDLSFDCPTCRAALKVEDKKIVRGRPSFDSGVDTNVFSQMFGRQNSQASGKSSGPIVDIEAVVKDKD